MTQTYYIIDLNGARSKPLADKANAINFIKIFIRLFSNDDGLKVYKYFVDGSFDVYYYHNGKLFLDSHSMIELGG